MLEIDKVVLALGRIAGNNSKLFGVDFGVVGYNKGKRYATDGYLLVVYESGEYKGRFGISKEFLKVLAWKPIWGVKREKTKDGKLVKFMLGNSVLVDRNREEEAKRRIKLEKTLRNMKPEKQEEIVWEAGRIKKLKSVATALGAGWMRFKGGRLDDGKGFIKVEFAGSDKEGKVWAYYRMQEI